MPRELGCPARELKRPGDMTMRMKTLLLTAAAVAALCGGLAARATQITGSGATFPDPIYEKWFSDYDKLHPDVQINYQQIGSGGGITNIIQGTTFFGASDMPMKDED